MRLIEVEEKGLLFELDYKRSHKKVDRLQGEYK